MKNVYLDEDLWFVVKCYNDYVRDMFDYPIDDRNIPVTLDEFYNNDYLENKEEFLNYLWEDFEYIDIDKNGNILEDFYIWKKGTHRGDIWEWFDIR